MPINTLYDYYTSKGQAMPTLSERGKIYEQMGLGSATSYAGNSQQNTNLLNKLTGSGSVAPATPAAVAGATAGSVASAPVAPVASPAPSGAYSTPSAASAPRMGVGSTATPQTPINPAVVNAQNINQANEAAKAAQAKMQQQLNSFQLNEDNSESNSFLKSIEDLMAGGNEPTAPDYAAEYGNLAAQYGIDPLQGQITAVDQQIADMRAMEAKAISIEDSRLAPQAVLALREQKLGKDFDQKLNNLFNQKAVYQNSLATKLDTVNNLMSFKKQSYADAVASYDRKIQNAVTLQQLFAAEETREYNRDLEIRKDAQNNLSVIQSEVKDYIASGNDFASLPDSLKLQIRKLELQAGMPEGATEQLIRETPANEEIVFKQLSNDETKLTVLVRKADGTMETRTYATGLSPVVSGGGGGTISSGKLLSPTEAAALNVPYGTTEAQAAMMGIVPQGKTTQAQETVSGYATRIESATNTLQSLESKIAKYNPLMFYGEMNSPTNYLKSNTIQQYDQAARNLINAIMRRESGAVISNEEFENARLQYLPLPGDTADTLAQKRQNVADVLGSYKKAAGNAYSSVNDLVGTGNTGSFKSTSGKTYNLPY